jgi:NitT/TauT family transport system permease protein
MNTELGRKLASVALIVGMFVVWELLCLMFHVSDVVLPRPSQVFITLWQRAPALWPHTVQTLYTTMLGFVLGVAIGVIIGVVIGWSKLAYDVAYPLLIGFSSVPKVAVVPILVLYFGSGTVPAVITALITCLFPVVVNVATGLATTEPELEDVMKALHATKFDILWNVGLPRAMPYFFASLKVAITLAFVGSVISCSPACSSWQRSALRSTRSSRWSKRASPGGRIARPNSQWAEKPATGERKCSPVSRPLPQA